MSLDHVITATSAVVAFLGLTGYALHKAHLFSEVDTRPACPIVTSYGPCSGRVNKGDRECPRCKREGWTW